MNNRLFYGLLLGNFFFVYGSERELQVYPVSMDEYDQIVFSKNPNVPAARELISDALKKNDFNEAALCATRATFNDAGDIVDPCSALTLSGLLLHKEKIPAFQHLSLREKANLAGRLLEYASMPRNLAADGKRILQYQNAQAQEQLQQFREIAPRLSHEVYEEEMTRLDKNQLEQRVPFEVLRDRALPAACFFAKKSLSEYREWSNRRKQLCISLDAQHALNWTTFVLGNPEGPQMLRDSGVEEALERVWQASADEDLKKCITQVFTKINEGRIVSSKEQETARHNLLGLCASTDLRALLLLAQENDPKLFYGSQLVYSLAKVSEQDYPELLKGSLELLARRMPEPESNYVLNNGQKLDTPQTLMMRIIQSNHFQNAKQKFSSTTFMCEVGEILHEVGRIEVEDASLEQIQNLKKIRQCGKDLIYKAREKGNVRAQWKVLGLQDPNAQTVQHLAKACEDTGKTVQKHDEALLFVIDQALEHIETFQNAHPDRKICAALGSLYLKGIGQLKSADHSKAVSYLTAAGADGINALLAAADSITCPETCLYAATQLYTYYDTIDQEKFSSAITKYLHHAKFGDQIVKKETLYLLKTAQDAKADYQIAQTLRQFLAALDDDAQQWKNESAFVNEMLDFCIERSKTKLASKILLVEILNDYGSHIKHPAIANPIERAKELQYECAVVDRDPGSILLLLPQFDTVEQSLPAITKAARIWHACSQVFTGLPVKRDEAAKKIRELVTQYDQILIAAREPRTDLSFDYYACMVLAESDPREATRLLHRVEEEAKNNALIIPAQNQELIETTGFNKFIESSAAQGKGWGFFAQAVLQFFRNRFDITQPTLLIENLEQINALLKRAKEASKPYVSDAYLTSAMIHNLLGVTYNNKAELLTNNDESQMARELAIYHLDQASQMGHVGAGVEWAYQVLHNRTEEIKSQMLERAIDRLIQGINHNNDAALEQLNKMQSYGLVQGWACGGMMTSALLDRIENELVSWALNRLQNKSDRSGQKFFEKIIDQLIKGVKYNNAQARDQLKIMQTGGLEQVWACGGAMNESLLAKINAALENRTEPVRVAAASSSSQSSEPCSQPSQTTPINNVDCGITFFEQKKYQQAFERLTASLEQSLSAVLHAVAYAYLGMIHEQGLVGTPNIAKAIDFYKKALLVWDGSVSKYGTVFTPAVRALIDQPEADLESAHALLNFALHSAHQQSSDDRVSIIFEALKNMEIFAARSKKPAVRNLIFTSGIARRLSVFYNKYQNVSFLLGLVSHYARRICKIGIPDPQAEQENLLELMVPFNDLSGRLVLDLLNNTPGDYFEKLKPEVLKELFNNLEQAVQKFPNHPHIPLTRLLGLLYLARGKETKNSDVNRRAVALLQQASHQNDAEAGLMLGVVNLCGPTRFAGVTFKSKEGRDVLEGFLNKGSADAGMALARWFEEKKDYRTAERYIKKVLEIDPTHGEAAFVAAKIYHKTPSLIPSQDHNGKKINKGIFLYNLCEVARVNMPSLALRAQAWQVLIACKYPDAMSLDEIGKAFENMCHETDDDLFRQELFDLTLNYEFHSILVEFLKKQTTDLETKKKLEPVFRFMGWWLTLMGNYQQHKKVSYTFAYQKAEECLKFSDELTEGKSLQVKTLLLKLMLERPFTDETERISATGPYAEQASALMNAGNGTAQEKRLCREQLAVHVAKALAVKLGTKAQVLVAKK